MNLSYSWPSFIFFLLGSLGDGSEAFNLQAADERIFLWEVWSQRNDLKILTLEVSQTNNSVKSSGFHDTSPSQEVS